MRKHGDRWTNTHHPRGRKAHHADVPPTDEQRTERLMALYVWHKEWAKIARAVIKRRDLPIRLGLASARRSGNGGTGGAGGTG